MRRINKNLVFFSGIFVLLLTILTFSIQKFSPLIGHATYYCQSLINNSMVPVPYYLQIIPLGFVTILLSFSLIKLIILMIKIKYLACKLDGKATTEKQIHKLIRKIGLEQKILVVKSNDIFAFCLGIKTPKIYISTGLTSRLSQKEIEAVLQHEDYHLKNHDTFIMVVASMAYSLFFFFPILGDLIRKYRIEREIAADKYSIEKVGNSYSLVSALRKLIAFPTTQAPVFTAIADQDTLEPRIYSLINREYSKKHLKIKHVFISLFSSLIIGLVILTPVYANEIHDEKKDIMMLCTKEDNCVQSCVNDKKLLFTPASKLPIDK